MPPIFKALASIAVWVLFIVGWIAVVVPWIMGFVMGELLAGPPGWSILVPNAIGIVSLILSVCAMKLRQMLE